MTIINNNITKGGGGFTGLLTILFIGLKLTGAISWSWFWVLSPLWIPFALVLLMLLCVGIFLVKSYLAEMR